MKRIFLVLLPVVLIVTLQPGRAAPSDGDSRNMGRISVQELKSRLGSTDFQLMDVRDSISWAFSGTKIPGAVRENPSDVNSWAAKYSKDRVTILYCKHDTTSASEALQLLEKGFTQVFILKGGWSAWTEAGFPTEKK